MMPLSRTRLLIRADGGPKVGTGHVMRMLALGQAYQKRGGDVTFVIGDLPQTLVRRLEYEKFQVFRIRNDRGNHADAIDTREIAALVQPQWIALDGYRFDDSYEAWMANSDAKLIVMDDYQHTLHQHADLVVNQNIYADPKSYEGSLRGRLLTGSNYALLRKEFSTPENRKTPPIAKRVLVTFGGADPDNWTLRTLQVLSDMKLKRIVVDCVLGSCYQAYPELDEFKRYANLSLRVHKNVDRMATLMQRVDLAITAGGSTCYELARCGVPAIVLPIADNQQPVAAALHHAGAMRSVDHSESVEGDRCRKLMQLVRSLVRDPSSRKQMSELGCRLVDGRGALRIVDRMAGKFVEIRDASVDDAKMLWQWRNDPEVRAVSFSSTSIELPQHQAWLQRQIEDTNSRVWVAENQHGQPLGSIRFNLDQSLCRATVSIIVDPRFRSRGVGSALIQASVARLFETTPAREILAQIKSGNVASEKAFVNAGFRPIEPVVLQGAMAQQFLLSRGPYQWNRSANRKSA
ncbi:MAG: UDP-2,4-diacetamido-2,4,6-trideoxy-beta-L-altropyranose hydrolase [Planctomycetota bacterium]